MVKVNKATTYFMNGDGYGPKRIDLDNWSGKVIYSPVSDILYVLDSVDLERPGVYILKSDDGYEDRYYIGEAGNVLNRIKVHMTRDDGKLKCSIYSEIVIIVDEKDLFTSTHSQGLECKMIELAPSHKLDNEKKSRRLPASDPDRRTIDDCFEYSKVVLHLLGFTLFEEKTEKKSSDGEKKFSDSCESDSKIYSLNMKGLYAEMYEDNMNNIVVLKDSQFSKDFKKSLYDMGKDVFKNDMISKGYLRDNGDHYILVEDYKFNSTSDAAAIILGASASGPRSWLDSDGYSYREKK